MTASPTLSPPAGPQGRHVLFALAGFFAVFVAVDGYMIYSALSTFGGVDNVNAYRATASAYNDRIAQEARQSEVGWREQRRRGLGRSAAPQGRAILDRDGRSCSRYRPSAPLIARPATNQVLMSPRRCARPHPEFFEANVAAFDPREAGSSPQRRSSRRGDDDKSSQCETRRRVWLKPWRASTLRARFGGRSSRAEDAPERVLATMTLVIENMRAAAVHGLLIERAVRDAGRR